MGGTRGETVERDRELAEIAAAIDAACAGAGGVVVVEAAAGLGKTRLLRAARDRGRDAGMAVLAARGTELERGFPFAVVRQLLEPPLVALAASEREEILAGAAGAARGALGLGGDRAAADPDDSFAVLHGLYWLVAALSERRPLLLAVDDAHWADPASLEFLAFLTTRLDESAVLLALACRPAEVGVGGPLARISADPSARSLEPRPLGVAGAATLLAAELDDRPDEAFVAACHEASAGNPFLLCELARTVVAERIAPVAGEVDRLRELAPDRVTRTAQLRLARLSPAARAVARAVVVLGDGADGPLVADFAGLDRAAVARGADELRAAAILDPGRPLRFIHPLTRTALAAELPPGESSEAHTSAVALLRDRGAGAGRLAAHLLLVDPCGDPEAAAALLAAAQAALASGAPRSAGAYLARALREPPPLDLRGPILEAAIGAGVRAPGGKLFESVMPAVREAMALEPDLRVRWAMRLSMWMILNGRLDDAGPMLAEAAEVARRRGDAADALRLEAQLSVVEQWPVAVARERLTGYAARVPADSRGGRLAAAFEAEWQAFDGTAAAATAAAERALAHDGRIFVEQPEFFAPGRAVLALVLADELEAARRAVGQALAHASGRSATPELVAARWMSGIVAWAFGDLAAAEADVRQALDAAHLGRLALAELPLRAVLACLLVARGELDSAEEELARTGVTGEVPDAVWFAPLLFARGQLSFARGEFERAAADMLQVERLSDRWGAIGVPAAPARVCAAEAVAAAGDRERALALAEAAVGHARRWGAPTLVARALGALARTVDGAERLAAVEEAVEVLDGSPARLVRAEALVALGGAWRRDGRRADARAPLREGLDLARRGGAAALAKRAFDELAATGERVRHHTPIGVESLTPSQRRVAELAASGLTNREIAQSLFLTVKTVESHLAAAYDKLGIRSRAQLPGVLGEPS